MKRDKYDTGITGLIFGIVVPLITMLIFYWAMYSHLELLDFLHRLLVSGLFMAVLSICVISNLLLFFICIWTKRDFAARGVLGATFIYAFIVMGFRFFG